MTTQQTYTRYRVAPYWEEYQAGGDSKKLRATDKALADCRARRKAAILRISTMMGDNDNDGI